MKTKNEIYVVLDTPKKAKKLQKVLDMFGEKTYNELPLELNVAIHFWHNKSWAFCIENYYPENKQKVSIKELRNILAVEKLKEGDVIVCEDNGDTAIGVYKEHDEFGFDLPKCKYSDRNHVDYEGGCFNNFIRYATEEERLLLESKEENKELEVGKWYTCDDMKNVMVFYESYGKYYGTNNDGLWTNVNTFDLNSEDPYNYREATAEEVKQALIKESEKLYNVGDKVKSLTVYANELIISEMKFNQLGSINDLWVTCENGKRNCLIFRDGKWAEVLPQPETQPQITDHDISTLERLHDTLADVHGYSLEFELMKSARLLAEKLRELNTQKK